MALQPHFNLIWQSSAHFMMELFQPTVDQVVPNTIVDLSLEQMPICRWQIKHGLLDWLRTTSKIGSAT